MSGCDDASSQLSTHTLQSIVTNTQDSFSPSPLNLGLFLPLFHNEITCLKHLVYLWCHHVTHLHDVGLNWRMLGTVAMVEPILMVVWL